MASSINRNSLGHQQEYKFEFNPTHQGHTSRPFHVLFSPHINDAILLKTGFLESIKIDRHTSPVFSDLYGPYKKVPYPEDPQCYLRIESHVVVPQDMEDQLRPYLMFVLRTNPVILGTRSIPPTISRISLMGNLLMPPTYNDKGPVQNFGLPRTIQIYTSSWNPPFSLENLPPHPRDWKLVYENHDLRSLWGWTHLDFQPVNTDTLIFFMSDLPVLPADVQIYSPLAQLAEEEELSWEFRGLSIQRLGIFQHADFIKTSKDVEYAPAASWHGGEYLPTPYESKYWKSKGISSIIQSDHQSIYREEYEKGTGFDLLPSSLVGLPSMEYFVGMT